MNSIESSLTADFEKEKARTKECLDDVMGFLSHDTSCTRRQLAEVLRQRAALIELGIHRSRLFENARSEEVEEGYSLKRIPPPKRSGTITATLTKVPIEPPSLDGEPLSEEEE